MAVGDMRRRLDDRFSVADDSGDFGTIRTHGSSGCLAYVSSGDEENGQFRGEHSKYTADKAYRRCRIYRSLETPVTQVCAAIGCLASCFLVIWIAYNMTLAVMSRGKPQPNFKNSNNNGSDAPTADGHPGSDRIAQVEVSSVGYLGKPQQLNKQDSSYPPHPALGRSTDELSTVGGSRSAPDVGGKPQLDQPYRHTPHEEEQEPVSPHDEDPVGLDEHTKDSQADAAPPSPPEVDWTKFDADNWQEYLDTCLAELKRLTEADPTEVSIAEKQRGVVVSFRWAWNRYRACAWGQDELNPVACKGENWFHLGATIVDSLDTMLLMGLKHEYKEAAEWVRESLDLGAKTTQVVNLFETTIRLLGGLLAAYHMSHDDMLLRKATALGERLLPAFRSDSGIPYSDVNLYSGQVKGPEWGGGASSVSEVATLCLEFIDLARLTGRFDDFARPAHRVIALLQTKDRPRGLVPMFINPITGKFGSSSRITLGARVNSYYEYLLKVWVQSGHRDELHLSMYQEALEGIRSELFYRSKTSQLLYVVEKEGKRIFPKMDHLVCFLPGVMALGVLHGAHNASYGEAVLHDAEELAYTCWQTYARTPTGLAAEITHFRTGERDIDVQVVSPNSEGAEDAVGIAEGDNKDGDIVVKWPDAHNLLRPETVESLFILWRITKKPCYRDWGWEIWRAIERYTRLDSGGYTSIKSVLNKNNVGSRDKMESFYLAETLKYLYLLFDDDPDVVPLDKMVFNTEAHPLPILSDPLPHLDPYP